MKKSLLTAFGIVTLCCSAMAQQFSSVAEAKAHFYAQNPNNYEQLLENHLGIAPAADLAQPMGGGCTYSAYDQNSGVAWAWTDISGTGAVVVTGDDVVGTQALVVPVTIYGTSYPTLGVSTNGFLSDPANTASDFSNDCPIPSANVGGLLRIYGLHDDLVGTVYYEDTYPALYPHPAGLDLGAAVFQWSGYHYDDVAQVVEFQILVYDNGDIYYVYNLDPEGGSGSTVGIQNPGATVATSYSCNTAGGIVPGTTAVLLTENIYVDLGADITAACGQILLLEAVSLFGTPVSYDFGFGAQTEATLPIVGNADGFINVIVTDANGCTGSDFVNIFASQLSASFEPQILGLEATYCEGTAEVLAVPAGGTFNSPNITDGNAISASATNVAIPDNNVAGVDISLSVSGTTAEHVLATVCVDLVHTWVGDVKVTLTSPQGTTVTLIDRPGVPATGFGCSSDNLFASFIPGIGSSIESACNLEPGYGIGGVFTAETGFNLADFDGEDLNGNWTVNVSDLAGGDVGQVLNVSVTFSEPNVINLDAFGPGSHSVTYDAAYCNGCQSSTTFSFDVIGPDAGTITADATPVCLVGGSATITATPVGDSFVPTGYVTAYVLTEGAGLVIVDVQSSPSFTVNAGGNYTIHTLVLDPADQPTLQTASTGVEVNAMLVQGGGTICASLDVTGAAIQVGDCDCNGDFGGTASIDDCGICAGGNTGIEPGNSVTVDMTDDFPDGWNGAIYEIFDNTDPLNPVLVVSGDLDNAQTGNGSSVGQDILCLPDGCYLFSVGGGAWDDEIGWTLSGVDGGPITGGAPESVPFTINTAQCSVLGCTDPASLNYNPAATIDDGSCIYGPANDACAGAITIDCSDDGLAGTTINSTVDAEYINCGAGGTNTTQRGVWYKVIGDDQQYIINTCNTPGFDTRLTVFSGDCGSLSCVTGNDDMGGASCSISGLRSEVTFNANAGTDYYVYVHGYQSGTTLSATGDFILNISCTELCVPVPANDVCAAAASLSVSGTCSPVTGTTQCASTAPSNPSCFSAFVSLADVWYSFVAPADGEATMNITNVSAVGTGYAVYDACGGTQVDCNASYVSGTDVAWTGLTAGATYYVQVMTNGVVNAGDFTICVTGNVPDCNGDLGGSAFLDDCNECVGGNTGLTACVQDCNGDFGGTAFLDDCNECVGGNTGLTACVQDCHGDWGGTAFIDNCGDCVGGNTGEEACPLDCHGDDGGTAVIDNCGDCVGGNTGLEACVQDCNQEWGGTAFIDECGECVGGSTGLEACDPVGVAESLDRSLNVYPNPNNGQFIVELNGAEGVGTLNIMDMMGRRVYTAGVNFNGSFRQSIDLNVAKGTYVLQVITQNGIATRKVELH